MRHYMLTALAMAWGCNGELNNNINKLNPDIIVAPGEVEFGDVVVLYDAEQVIQVSNAGRAPLNVIDMYVEGDADGVYTITPTSVSELPPDESIGVGIVFAPATYLPYDYDLVIVSDDPDSPEYRVPITGEGVDGPIPDISLSPASLDFGLVTSGDTAPMVFYINNDGDGDLIVEPFVQEGSGNFTIVGSALSTATVPPGGTYPVAVNYTPTTEDGDNGSIWITSNDPDEGLIELVMLGNGGGDFEYPVASIDCPSDVAPPVRVQLDGTDSYDPNGSDLTYAWTLDDAPIGSTSVIENDVADVANLFVNLSGRWEVSLRVTNSVDLVSAPAVCTFEGIPDDQIQVELTWDTGDADFDLHLIQNDGPMFLAPGDCCYCNPNPDWGGSGNSDDPDLSLDNRTGFGPEVTSILTPEDAEYYAKVHYFADNGGGTSIATVRVFINGVVEHEASMTMEHNDVWDVGYIRWPEAVFVEQANELYTPETRSCYY